jgi:hypothetical protein
MYQNINDVDLKITRMWLNWKLYLLELQNLLSQYWML